MVEDIVKILKTYHDRKTYVDNDFVVDLSFLIASYYNIEDYVENIIIDNDYKGRNSIYLYCLKTIKYNIEKIFNYSDYDTLKDNYYGMFNLMVLKTIFHEIEHAKQEMVMDNYPDSLEGKLLLLCNPVKHLDLPEKDNSLIKYKIDKYKWKKFHSFYDKNYYSAPNERMAILKSCIDSNIICNNEFIKETPYYELFNKANKIDFSYTLAYRYKLIDYFTNSPVLEYLYNEFKDNRKIVLTDKDFYNYDIDPETRLFCGLSLSSYELENQDNIIDNMVKIKSII